MAKKKTSWHKQVKQIKKHHILGVAFFAVVFGIAVTSYSFLFQTNMAHADCSGPIPPKPPKIVLQSGLNKGQLTILWDPTPSADKYSLFYGVESNKYIYGVPNINPMSPYQKFTVQNLRPGQKYYFRVVAFHTCYSSPYSDEVSGFAAR